MKYTREEVMQYIAEEDVKFIRLAFCDIFGRQKNVSIVPEELKRAFSDGIAIDASAISGFGGKVHSDLFLHPDPSTLSVLPWRPENGKVVRMYCRVVKPDGTAFEGDTRRILGDAVKRAKEKGITFAFGSEMEFYLFKQDEQGEQTKIPYDRACVRERQETVFAPTFRQNLFRIVRVMECTSIFRLKVPPGRRFFLS